MSDVEKKYLNKYSRTMWVDDFNGLAKGGYFYRSKFGREVREFEFKFNVKVVGVIIDNSYDIEFIIEEKE